MAHQCLQCGRTFPDGSAELLRGCPQCQGTRFFYTQAPLAQAEREALMREANQDIRAILQELAKGSPTTPRPSYEDPVWSNEARERWLRVDARKLRAREAGAVREVQAPASAPPPGPAAPPPRAPPARDPPREPAREDPREASSREAPRAPPAQATLPLAPERPEPSSSTPALDDSQPREAKPEVVVVHEPGTYELDVKQLMENRPVVVRRDGVYVVHLPSAFAAAKR